MITHYASFIDRGAEVADAFMRGIVRPVSAVGRGIAGAGQGIADLVAKTPLRRRIALPIAGAAVYRSQKGLMDAPVEYVDPRNDRWRLDNGILFNSYKRNY